MNDIANLHNGKKKLQHRKAIVRRVLDSEDEERRRRRLPLRCHWRNGVVTMKNGKIRLESG